MAINLGESMGGLCSVLDCVGECMGGFWLIGCVGEVAVVLWTQTSLCLVATPDWSLVSHWAPF